MTKSRNWHSRVGCVQFRLFAVKKELRGSYDECVQPLCGSDAENLKAFLKSIQCFEVAYYLFLVVNRGEFLKHPP